MGVWLASWDVLVVMTLQIGSRTLTNLPALRWYMHSHAS